MEVFILIIPLIVIFVMLLMNRQEQKNIIYTTIRALDELAGLKALVLSLGKEIENLRGKPTDEVENSQPAEMKVETEEVPFAMPEEILTEEPFNSFPEIVIEPVIVDEKEPIEPVGSFESLTVKSVTPAQSVEPEKQPKQEKRKINYEKLIGENIFSKIGILVLVVGAGLFVKYAIDQNWIGEVMRTIISYIGGAILLSIAWKLRREYRTFSSVLAGGGCAVFYVTTTVAFQYYHVFHQVAALSILVLTTVFMSLVSARTDRRELAVFALVGGFLSPFLVSTGTGNYHFLFSYIIILDMGMFVLSYLKKWKELPVISFVASFLVLILYAFNESFYNNPSLARDLFIYLTAFYFLYLIPARYILLREENKRNILLVLVAPNAFLYFCLGLYFLTYCDPAFECNALFAFCLGVVNLSFYLYDRYRLHWENSWIDQSFLAVGITFITMAIPIQFKGGTTMLLFTAESFLLFWLYVRFRIAFYERSTILLSFITLVMIWTQVSGGYYGQEEMLFFNASFLTNICVPLVFALYAYILWKEREKLKTSWLLRKYGYNVFIAANAVTLFYVVVVVDLNELAASSLFPFLLSCYTTAYLFLLSYLMKYLRFSHPVLLGGITLMLTFATLVFLIFGAACLNFGISGFAVGTKLFDFCILTAFFIYTARLFYRISGFRAEPGRWFVILLNVLASFVLLLMVQRMLWVCSLPDPYNSAPAITLALIAFAQMWIGMKYHYKLLRVIALIGFGLVLLKLLLFDLWQLQTLGKIAVFISLGVLLLVVSFLYQRLKNVLFKEDQSGDSIAE